MLAVVAAALSTLCSVSYATGGSSVVRLAFINPHSASSPPSGIKVFWERLRELGYVEGRNRVIDAPWADNLRTARALRLSFPESVLLRANEVVR